jgi:protein-disulfide isomerase
MTDRPSPARARRPWLGAGVALAVGVVAAALLQLAPRPAERLARTPVVAAALDDPGSPRAGPPTAAVTVVVFTDYQCPICKATDGALAQRLAADPDVRVIWKDWPIRGPASELAARTALAAAWQGRYPAIHAALMAARGPLTPERIDAIAATAGADPIRLAADRTAHAREIDAQLARHRLQAFGLGFTGTPGYLVGAYRYAGGLDDRRLAQAIARARRAGPPRPP